MIYEIVDNFPNDIIYDNNDVCISIYQSTSLDNNQDRLIFKNQLDKVRKSLLQLFKEDETNFIMKPLYNIEKDLDFWLKTNGGLAILMNRKKCIVYNLFRTVKEYTAVADNFHIKPLLRIYQSADKYYVLGVNRQTFKLFYGDRYEFRELKLPNNIDITIEEVLGDQYQDRGRSQIRGKQSGQGMYSYGQGDKKEYLDTDIEKYFRYIDSFIYNNYSKPANTNLILASLSEYYGIFKKITKNLYLMNEHIDKDFTSLSNDEIRKESWKIMEKVYLNKTHKLVDRFLSELDKFNASDDLGEIAHQAISNRIDTVLIESDTIILGNIDKDTGYLTLDKNSNHDVLDEIAELVLLHGGEVVMLPKDKMPTKMSAAAIYRY